MEKSVLPWKSMFCREKVCFAVEKSVLRGKVCFAVKKYVLPWKKMFCRGKVCFAVADMGHRILLSSLRIDLVWIYSSQGLLGFHLRNFAKDFNRRS